MQTNKEFQDVIKSPYSQVFKIPHVMNETLSLEFVHGIVVKNKGIHVNWASYAYFMYKKNDILKVQGKHDKKT